MEMGTIICQVCEVTIGKFEGEKVTSDENGRNQNKCEVLMVPKVWFHWKLPCSDLNKNYVPPFSRYEPNRKKNL